MEDMENQKSPHECHSVYTEPKGRNQIEFFLEKIGYVLKS